MILMINRLLLLVLTVALASCSSTETQENPIDHTDHEHSAEGHEELVKLSQAQLSALNITLGPIPQRYLGGTVHATGFLEVPPKNEATVTTIIGANVSNIKVIEGEEVKKGQVLAYLKHPSLIELQQQYLEAHSQYVYLEKEYKRQERLYSEQVGAGKDFQQVSANYQGAKAQVSGLEARLRQLNMQPARVIEGPLYNQVQLTSPIDGAITKVWVKTGAFADPRDALFEIVNIEHIHADLMVFEKDIHLVKKGQKVRFTVQSLQGKNLMATIYAVGKQFEQGPKAVHVHAEILQKTGNLLPGMYVQGAILTDSSQSLALPIEAVVRTENGFTAFMQVIDHHDEHKTFRTIQLGDAVEHNGWIAVKPLETLPDNATFALNQAYYLHAEMNKSEGGHHH